MGESVGIVVDEWENCYDGGWKGWIVPEAFSHPAKFSRALIERICDHAMSEGWVKQRDWVIDPFAGVALGGLNAVSSGLNWVGIELEEKFVILGEQNIELWQHELEGWPNLGTARIIQGDSRNLKNVIEKADLVVSSPPYSDSIDHAPGNKKWDHSKGTPGNLKQVDYGHTPGNLANLKEGKFDMVCGSPPYAESMTGQNTGSGEKSANDRYERLKKAGYDADSILTPGRRAHGNLGVMEHYGRSPGQLGAMKEGQIDCLVSSPPFELCDNAKRHSDEYRKKFMAQKDAKWGKGRSKNRFDLDQLVKVDTAGQLGRTSGDTFWSASKIIVQQCYDLLKPQGHAIWVTKDYVKKGLRVPFTDRWLALCESVGFKLVCHHHAMLVGLKFEKDHVKIVERKSFFRRTGETKIRAKNHWVTLSRIVQADYLRKSKKLAWESYYFAVALNDPDHPPIFPTKSRVVSSGQLTALSEYSGDVRDWDDDRIIYWEDVICFIK